MIACARRHTFGCKDDWVDMGVQNIELQRFVLP